MRPRITAEWFSEVNKAVSMIRSGNVGAAQEQLDRVNSATNVGVDVVNKSGTDIQRPGGVLKLDGLNFSFDDKPKQIYDRVLLKGIQPSSSSDDFVIVPHPLPNGKRGWGIKLGFAFCRLNYTDEEKGHTKATPGEYVHYLKSGTSGARIYWREFEDEDGPDTTGEQWALVFLGGGGDGKLSGEVNLYYFTTTGEVEAAADGEPGVGTADIFELFSDGTKGTKEYSAILYNHTGVCVSGSGLCVGPLPDAPPEPSPSPVFEPESINEPVVRPLQFGEQHACAVVWPGLTMQTTEVVTNAYCGEGEEDGQILNDKVNITYLASNCEPEPSPEPE